MISSSFRERAFQASQSPFTLCQTRLTVSFPTAPPNKAASAPAHPARVGPGKIGASDQRVGLFRPPLVGRNGRILPLDRLPVRCFQAGSRDTDRHRPEASHHWRSRWPCRWPASTPCRPPTPVLATRGRSYRSRPSAASSSASRSSSMKPRMRVRTQLPKDRTNRPQGKAFLRPLPPSLL